MFKKSDKLIEDGKYERGDIILFDPDGSVGSFLIDVVTHSHYHHIALYDGDGMVIEAMPGGVRNYPLGKRKVIGIRPAVALPQKLIAIGWAHSKIGDPYDHRALLMIGLDRVFPHMRDSNPSASRFICAVFISEAYHHAGIDLLPGKDWNDLVPGDFTELLEKTPTLVIPG